MRSQGKGGEKTMMKKLLVGISAAALLGVLATPALAERPEYGEQPGYEQANSCGAGHGSFAYFDGDTNLGVNSLGPGTPVYHNGATGQDAGATGYNNSHLCGNPQN